MVLLQRIYKAKMNKRQIIQPLVFPFVMIFLFMTIDRFKVISSSSSGLKLTFSQDPNVTWNNYFQIYLVWNTVDQIMNDREKYK